MSRRVRKSPRRRFYCFLHKEVFLGKGWGGHRRKCQAQWKELKARENPPGIAEVVSLLKDATVPAESKTATPADQVVRTVRSYLASLDEEYAKNTTRLRDIVEESKKLHTRQIEIRRLRATVVNPLKDLK
jgi:hypothetical protein